MFGAAMGMSLLPGAVNDRRASQGFGGYRGGFAGGSGFNPDVARAGHRFDHRYGSRYESLNWRKAKARGLTAQEYYGSPAPGAGSPISGAGAVLGNQAAAAIAARGASQSAMFGQMLQADTQKELMDKRVEGDIKIAEIGADATTRGQDLTYDAAMQRLQYDRDVYEETTRPLAARQARKTEHEIQKLVNEISTSHPKFVRMLKIMTMGTDNTLGLAIQNTLGIDVSDLEQMQNLSPAQRKNLIQGMMAAASVIAKETAGAQMTVNQYLDLFNEALIKASKEVGDDVKRAVGESGIKKAKPPVKVPSIDSYSP